MRRLIVVLIILLVAAVVSGCRSHETKKQDVQSQHMPPGFKIIEDLGNEWYVIEGKVQGKNRKYLYRYNFHYDQSTETIVEIKE